MVALIRAELRKLLTTQVWFWMLLISVGLTVLGVVAQIAGEKHDEVLAGNVHDVLTSAAGAFTYVPLFVLGALAVTTEYRYQTITPTVLATPSRWKLVTAKMITYALVGIVYAVICLVIQLAIALPWLSARHIHVSLADNKGPLLAVFAVLALYALVGMGAGALMRNQIVAVSIGVIFILILQTIVLAIPGVKNVYPYLLGGATNSILTGAHDDRTANGVVLLSQSAGVVTLAVWALVMAILGAGITMNRDIT